jgi:hypothetical protein
VDWKAGTVRAAWYLIALAGVGVLTAGCGTVHAGQSTSATLASAVSKTAAQTARIEITTATQAPGMSISFTETGEFDFARSRGMITMASPFDMTELFLPPRVYIKFSGMGSSLPHGKTWAVVDGGTSGSVDSMLGPFGSGDNPADMLASLTAVAGSERILGTTRVRGVLTTEYQVNIDPSKMAAKVPASERAGFRQFAQSFGQGAIPVDVWVDSQNQVRQVRLSLHTPAGAGIPGNTRVTMTVDFYDFGVPVLVSAPPASQVTSMSGDDVSVGSISQVSGSASGSASAVPVPPSVPPAAVSSPLPTPAITATGSGLGSG